MMSGRRITTGPAGDRPAAGSRRSRARGWRPAIFLLALLVAATGAEAALRIGSTLPSVRLDRTNGAPVRIPEQFKGKVLLLHFWQIGCTSCRLDMPAMDDLYGRYRRRGLEIVAVNVGQKAEDVKAYAVELGVSFPILVDPTGKSSTHYDAIDVPRTYVIDRNGVIRYRILGSATPETLKRLVLSLL
jgi:cytochrome c biogenesis protein CcmG, thiol:disulfide interchange protein DsbE